MLKLAVFFPHPPIVVPEVGGREAAKVSATAEAMEKLSRKINDIKPELIVAITPHGHVFSDAVTITAVDPLEGDLGQFGASQVKVRYELDREAAAAILDECRDSQISCAALDERLLSSYGRSTRLDHGLVVPLSFLARTGWQGSLVPVNMGILPYEELYHFGILLRQALDKLEKDWVLLISGDMSHCLLPGAPAGYSPQGAVFDEIIRQCIREGDIKRIFALDPILIEEAAECGLRPLIMGLGTLDGYEIEASELSYEGPFGVGYLVAELNPGPKAAERQVSRDLYGEREDRLNTSKSGESPLVRLARSSVEHYLKYGKYIDPPDNIEGGAKKAGAFVTLKKYGQLRGCIGTIEPVREDLTREVIYNAVSAALHDPRFEPLSLEELDELNISVDVLDKPEPVFGMEELDPLEYGVIVSRGSKKGLLLPHIAGINSAQEQVKIARQKAGIGMNEEVSLERFRVVRHT